ncbi:hypothetical protein [Pyxidicoccus trucidator]|uniref:hypothetical protein n=1 Tax=Pyxidicoccus trucidator TaxID=2709662 RepID=UPI0013DC89C8|nr:hypothetical protein [Pyxidicoccus trucidator]
MRERTFRRWGQAATLAVGMLLTVGCRGLPETGGYQADESRGNVFANRGEQAEALRNMEGAQPKEQLPPWTMTAGRGYNSTIKQLGSSIDPRTPQADGKQNNSIWDDSGKMMEDRYSSLGGAAYAPTSQGLGGEDGAREGNMPHQQTRAGYAPLGWQDRNARNLR